jgi:hypothetical protein
MKSYRDEPSGRTCAGDSVEMQPTASCKDGGAWEQARLMLADAYELGQQQSHRRSVTALIGDDQWESMLESMFYACSLTMPYPTESICCA